MNKSLMGALVVFLVFCFADLATAAEGAKTAPARGAHTVAPAQATPSLQVANALHDFGEAMEGSEVVHEFRIRNSGKGVLQVDEVRPG